MSQCGKTFKCDCPGCGTKFFCLRSTGHQGSHRWDRWHECWHGNEGDAWLATAQEMVETLQRLVEYDAEQDKLGPHATDCGCAYCAARALLARPEVKAWAGR